MTDTTQQDSSAARSSAGQLLQQARKQRQMSLDELAAETRIPRPVLEALEADRDPANQAPVFVRGFYRRCARALGLSEQEVVAAYEARAGALAPVKTVPSEWVSVARKPGGVSLPGGPWAMVATLAVIVCGILLVALLRDKKPDEAAKSKSHTVVAEAPLAQTQPAPAPAAKPEAMPGQPETATSSSPDAQPFTSPLQPTLPGPVAATETAETSATAAAPTDAQAATATGGSRSLVIEFVQSCWTSVSDADGNRLLQGIFNTGDRKEVIGKPPYRVVLGYAPGAKLFYEDQPFDISSQTEPGKLTARVTVPLE